MSDNKTMIRFYFVIFAVFTLLTYAVDLNGQFHFITLNTPLISNSFCFTILSGILTGVIVALTIEVRQYFMNKCQAKNALYAIASELYALISVQRASIKYYINNQDTPIPPNIGGDYAQQTILDRISQFRAIDYATFSKKDDIKLMWESFGKQIGMIESTVRNLVSLRIAYNQTKISFLEKYDNKSEVTASSSVMLNALRDEHDALQKCLVVIDGFCSAFENIDSRHFRWAKRKKVIDNISEKIEADVYYNPENK